MYFIVTEKSIGRKTERSQFLQWEKLSSQGVTILKRATYLYT